MSVWEKPTDEFTDKPVKIVTTEAVIGPPIFVDIVANRRRQACREWAVKLMTDIVGADEAKRVIDSTSDEEIRKFLADYIRALGEDRAVDEPDEQRPTKEYNCG